VSLDLLPKDIAVLIEIFIPYQEKISYCPSLILKHLLFLEDLTLHLEEEEGKGLSGMYIISGRIKN
jgi:hypothetical protein